LTTFVVTFAQEDTIKTILNASVTVKSSKSTGSGVIFTRKVGDVTRNFVWTAAHVIDAARRENEVGGKTIVTFKDVLVIKRLVQDGRQVGETRLTARVIKYSASEDLALLLIRKKNWTKASVTFHLKELPKIGSELYHVGSLLGIRGAGSITKGILSQHGRIIDEKLFDQTTVTAFPGSSGGGVFLKMGGACIGLILRGSGETFNFIVPVRRMHCWAKEAGIEWAIDATKPMPKTSDLFDTKHVDCTDYTKIENAELKKFPYLIRINNARRQDSGKQKK